MEHAIRLCGVRKKCKDQIILNNINLNIKRGSIYGLIGANGAGKTTIMKSILALTSIDDGHIEILGKRMSNYRDVPYYKIGNMIETPSFYPHLSARENLQVLCKCKGILKKDSIEEVLEKVGLDANDRKKFSQFSLGMKQRLGLANAIILNPTLLILDEPTNGLDPNGIVEIRNLLRSINQEFGTTILISSHILKEIEEIADTIGAIQNGKMVEECPIDQIYDRGRKYIIIKAQDITNVVRVLEKKIGITDYEVVLKQ